jgi:hypothetical protein
MTRTATRNPDHAFFTLMAILTLGVVLTGFGPSYYFKDFFDRPPLPLVFHVHGAVYTAWALLFLAQPLLARTGRMDLHRALGVVGVVIAVLVVVTGVLVLFAKPKVTEYWRAIILWPLMGLLAFTLLVAAAVYFRREAATHKRLMLAATVFILPTAVSRITTLYGGEVIPWLVRDISTALLLGPLTIYDLVRLRRIHPATIWGAAAHLVQQPLHVAFAYTAGWQATAAWLNAHLYE